MKILKQIFYLSPLALLVGCAAPVSNPTPYAEWRQEELLPPTGSSETRVYSSSASYPATEPNIIVQTERDRPASGDLALGDAIRKHVEYDRGLAPSLKHVTIEVRDGRVILSGSVKSDLDVRVIVDDLREIAGVTRISNGLQIDPTLD